VQLECRRRAVKCLQKCAFLQRIPEESGPLCKLLQRFALPGRKAALLGGPFVRWAAKMSAVESAHPGPWLLQMNRVRFMGKRREPRKETRVPVRIFGTDSTGQIFSEKVFTVNVSQQGVELVGVRAKLRVDDVVGLTYGTTKAHFRVRWVGEWGGAQAGRLGLLSLSPEKSLWDFPLPPPGFDAMVRDARDRRAHSRVKCANSVEVYRAGESVPVRTRTVDLSPGGCFLEMPNPLAKGTPVRIALWVKDFKLWASGEVVTSTPGFGIGVKFVEMTQQDRKQLRQFVESTVRIRI
jgi:PilZ domain